MQIKNSYCQLPVFQLLLKFTASTLTAGITSTYYNLSKYLPGSKKNPGRIYRPKVSNAEDTSTEEFSNTFFFSQPHLHMLEESINLTS